MKLISLIVVTVFLSPLTASCAHGHDGINSRAYNFFHKMSGRHHHKAKEETAAVVVEASPPSFVVRKVAADCEHVCQAMTKDDADRLVDDIRKKFCDSVKSSRPGECQAMLERAGAIQDCFRNDHCH